MVYAEQYLLTNNQLLLIELDMADNVIPFRRQAAPPPPADFDTARALNVCDEMLGLIHATMSPTHAAAYATQLFIHLHDLAQRARTIGRRLTFSHDVDLVEGVNDVTDLISKLRNAVCHIRSPTRNLGEASFVFNRFSGYIPQAIQINDHIAGCDYPDDMALYYGSYRFYVRRHGYRALDELKAIFARPSA